MTQNTALVTGATSGIGLEAAAQLAEAGYSEVIITGRTIARANSARTELVERTGRDVFRPLALDLGDPSSIGAAASSLAESSIDALILNAGLVSGSTREFTVDNIEVTFAASLIGHHRLAMQLMGHDALAPRARIVIAGSETARGDVPTMNLADIDEISTSNYDGDLVAAAVGLIRGELPKRFKPNDTYATTKLFVAWWAAALARRLPEGITVNAVSPGSTPDTNGARNANFLTRRVMLPLIKLAPARLNMAATVESSASRYLQAVAFPVDVNGQMYASKPKKMAGALVRMDYQHLNRLEHQEAVWDATVSVAEIGDSAWNDRNS